MLFPSKKVAIVFDFDKTLGVSYMQRPIFEHYGVDEKTFWATCHARAKANSKILGSRCFVEHEYLNVILDYSRRRIFKGLTNKKLAELGLKIKIFPGVEECFKVISALGAEIYIVSSGMKAMLTEIPFVKKYVTAIFAAEFADYQLDEKGNIKPFRGTLDKPQALQSVTKVMLPSDKTRVLHEINKGCLFGGFDGCIRIEKEDCRTPFDKMVYVGDGISDVYAFDTVKSNGGFTMGVYNPEEPQFTQLEMLRQEGWLDIMAVADYSWTATAGNWLISKTKALVASIEQTQNKAIEASLEDRRRCAPEYVFAWSKLDGRKT
jgi:2-hydroxy-3-keto-5-methylthiopentenyl-1-phosphate phosphatase